MLRNVISRGQTGADQGALQAAKEFGVTTGGYMPWGFRTQSGHRPEFANEFGMRQLRPADDRSADRVDVYVADATLRFITNPSRDTPRSRWMSELIERSQKPHFEFVLAAEPPDQRIEDCVQWLVDSQIEVLNVFGDTENECPRIAGIVTSHLNQLFRALLDHGELEQSAESIWKERPTNSRRRRIRSVVDAFLGDPCDETLAPVRKLAREWIWEAICRAVSVQNIPQETPSWSRSLVVVAEDVESYVETRLRAFIDGRVQTTAELTEGFSVPYDDDSPLRESLEAYVVAVTLFYLLQSVRNQEGSRQRVATTLVFAFKSYLARTLRQLRQMTTRDILRDAALQRLLEENTQYLLNDDNREFGRLVANLRRRCKWRLRDAMEHEPTYLGQLPRDLPEEEWEECVHRESPSDQSTGHVRQLREEIETKARALSEAAYPIACEAAGAFPNADGRRLVLWLILGGLSLRRRNGLRGEVHETRYLVQPGLIDELEQGGATIDRAFAQPVDSLMQNLDYIERVRMAYCEEMNSRLHEDGHLNPDELAELVADEREVDPDEVRLHGWKVFLLLSDQVVRMIHAAELTPDVNIVETTHWVAWLRTTLNNPEQRNREVLAGFTKFLCLFDKSQDWSGCLKEFSEQPR